ncbi:MAG: tol-pal system protein YbgF [Hyphomicrobium sp.]|jgi:tol-pal system protein YbgF
MVAPLLRVAIAAFAMSLLLGRVQPLHAQQPGAGVPTAGTAAKPKASAAKSDTQPATAAPASAANAALAQRVEQLEAQLVDLQVVIGTLESLARSGGPRPVPAGGGGLLSGGDQGRLDSMDTQIRALTSQVEQLAQELHGNAGAGRRSDAGAPAARDGFNTASGYAEAPSATDGATSDVARFGSTTVTSGSLDPINALAGADPRAQAAGSKQPAASSSGIPPGAAQVATTEAAAGNPKELYETAYGYLLQQDYSSAQSGFSEFLKTYPKDRLAPDALYWLGEVHYVQRNFANAAEAFDLVTSAYGSSSKAADALLKRGMSLSQLGKKQEACAAWRDIPTKYPSAPAHVKSKADSERQRAGCT